MVAMSTKNLISSIISGATAPTTKGLEFFRELRTRRLVFTNLTLKDISKNYIVEEMFTLDFYNDFEGLVNAATVNGKIIACLGTEEDEYEIFSEFGSHPRTLHTDSLSMFDFPVVKDGNTWKVIKLISRKPFFIDKCIVDEVDFRHFVNSGKFELTIGDKVVLVVKKDETGSFGAKILSHYGTYNVLVCQSAHKTVPENECYNCFYYKIFDLIKVYNSSCLHIF